MGSSFSPEPPPKYRAFMVGRDGDSLDLVTYPAKRDTVAMNYHKWEDPRFGRTFKYYICATQFDAGLRQFPEIFEEGVLGGLYCVDLDNCHCNGLNLKLELSNSYNRVMQAFFDRDIRIVVFAWSRRPQPALQEEVKLWAAMVGRRFTYHRVAETGFDWSKATRLILYSRQKDALWDELMRFFFWGKLDRKSILSCLPKELLLEITTIMFCYYHQ
jgi:hypothetical protein